MEVARRTNLRGEGSSRASLRVGRSHWANTWCGLRREWSTIPVTSKNWTNSPEYAARSRLRDSPDVLLGEIWVAGQNLRVAPIPPRAVPPPVRPLCACRIQPAFQSGSWNRRQCDQSKPWEIRPPPRVDYLHAERQEAQTHVGTGSTGSLLALPTRGAPAIWPIGSPCHQTMGEQPHTIVETDHDYGQKAEIDDCARR